MKKTLLLLLFGAIAFINNADAQKTHADSMEIINVAQRYALRFRLSNRNLKRFTSEHFPATSDYFKPNARHTPKTLTSDSLFVKTFKSTAFENVQNQKGEPNLHDTLPPNHIVPVAGEMTYTKPSQQAAQRDAQRFKLSRENLKKFKVGHFPSTSDYFKPVAANASDAALLKDSDYVQTFRFEAYNKSYYQHLHPVGHGLAIAGIATGVAVLVTALVISFSRGGFL